MNIYSVIYFKLCFIVSVGLNYLSFLSFNGCTVGFKEWISNFIPHCIGPVIHAGIKVKHASKRATVVFLRENHHASVVWNWYH